MTDFSIRVRRKDVFVTVELMIDESSISTSWQTESSKSTLSSTTLCSAHCSNRAYSKLTSRIRAPWKPVRKQRICCESKSVNRLTLKSQSTNVVVVSHISSDNSACLSDACSKLASLILQRLSCAPSRLAWANTPRANTVSSNSAPARLVLDRSTLSIQAP